MSRCRSPVLVLIVTVGAAVPITGAQSLTTTFSGTVQSIGNGAGTFFDVTALDPGGIVVDGFDVHLGATAGTAVPVHFYYRPGSYVGLEQDMTQWRYLGHRVVVAAGVGNPTPVDVGGVHIRHNETIGFRFGNGASNQRYNTEATTEPQYFNDDLRINLGAAQNTSFFNSAVAPRGWNGTIHYTLGASVADGACCLPDGTCIEGRIEVCHIGAGTYQGDGTACAALPGGCPPPEPGACCFADGSCSLEMRDPCQLLGGIFNGDGTPCSASSCGRLDAFSTTITITTGQYAGNFFNVSAIAGLDIEITGWDINLSSSAGTLNSVRVYYRPGPWEGFHNDAAAWTLVDEVLVTAAGPGNPTRVALRGPIIPAGQTYGFRLGPQLGALRYTSTFAPSIATDHVELIRGAAQGALFATSLIQDRGWQGVLHYRTIDTSPPCYANCDNSTTPPVLNVEDFVCFINEFANGLALPPSQQITHYANCDQSTTEPILNVEDFICFVNEFAQGCP
jgi:hypothetical protein